MGPTGANHQSAFLAPNFMDCCFGIDTDPSTLLPIFLHYIEPMDKEMLETAMKNISEVEEDDLLDTLAQFDCRAKITQDSIHDIITEIAHKELVQLPAFISKCWAPILQKYLKPLLNGNMVDILDALKPNTRKVLNLLIFEEKKNIKDQIFSDMLRRYVKSLDGCGLGRFLQFCTGKLIFI